MPIHYDTLLATLRAAFADAQIECTDLAGDNDHWQVSITSSAFVGKSRIEQHKLVQHAVRMHDIHALSIKTKTV